MIMVSENPNRFYTSDDLPLLRAGLHAKPLESTTNHYINLQLMRNPDTFRFIRFLPYLYEILPQGQNQRHDTKRAIIIASGLTNRQLDNFLAKSNICPDILCQEVRYPGRVIVMPWMKSIEATLLHFSHAADVLTDLGITETDLYGYSYAGYYLGLFGDFMAQNSSIQPVSLSLELSMISDKTINSDYIKTYHQNIGQLDQAVIDRLNIIQKIPMPVASGIRRINYFGTSSSDRAADQSSAVTELLDVCRKQRITFRHYIFDRSPHSDHRIHESQQHQIAQILIETAQNPYK